MRGPLALGLGAVALAALALAPLALASYPLGLLTKMLIFGVFAMSLNLVMGYGGLPSLGLSFRNKAVGRSGVRPTLNGMMAGECVCTTAFTSGRIL